MGTIFVSEFLTCGAWPRESNLSTSLAAEGRMMVESVLADLLDLSDLQVRLTWDRRLPPPQMNSLWAVGNAGPASAVSACSRVTLQWADAESEPHLRATECRRANHIFLIAPECDGILRERVSETERYTNATVWNATSHAVGLCTDKLQSARHLGARGVSVIPTCSIDDDLPGDWCDLIVKPIDGAGSQNIRKLTRLRFESWRRQQVSRSPIELTKWIVQPWVEGRPLSVAAIFGADGLLHDVWPVAEQHLAPENFSYLGGRIPAAGVNQSKVQELVSAVAKQIPGLRGYIGMDLIERPDGEIVLTEINPRLTTSYVGYRQLAGESLAAWLEPRTRPLRSPSWSKTAVQFTAGGTTPSTPETEGTPA